jgi:hypothetical protein
MTYDAFIDAWTIAAGGLEPPAPEEVPAELQDAASVLLALPRAGLAEQFFGDQEMRLRALGGDWRHGLRRLPHEPAERREFLQRVFGARKRVIEALALTPVLDANGVERAPLPRPFTQTQDPPERSSVRKLLDWALRQGMPVEVLTGPLAGMQLEDLPHQERAALLNEAEASWLEDGASLRIRTSPIPIGLLIPGGTDHPFHVARCSAPWGCTQSCPLFGQHLCQYRSGCGWDINFHRKSDDRRTVNQMPRRPGLPFMGGDRRRVTSAA